MEEQRRLVTIPGIANVAGRVIGILFLLSAHPKIVEPLEFFEAVQGYQLLPPSVALAVAFALPYIELVLGIALLAGFLNPGTTALVVLLCFMFLLAQVSVIARGIDINCGCFGGEQEPVGWSTVIRAALIMLISGLTLWVQIVWDAEECGVSRRAAMNLPQV